MLTEEQTLLLEAAGGFFAEQAPVALRRRVRDDRKSKGVDAGLWRAMGEMGFAGVLVPEADGGSGLGPVEAGLIALAAGRTLAPSPFLSSGVMAAAALAGGGEAERLGALAAGEAVIGLAVDEEGRHAPDRLTCQAEASGNGCRLTGAKTFVLDGAAADAFVVAAADAEGAGLFLVEGGADGLTRETDVLLDGSQSARLALEGAPAQRLGGADLVERFLSLGRACAAAEMTGLAEGVFALTGEHLRTRKQFGVEIGRFQALQHRAAHLFCEIELARAGTLKALRLLEADAADAAFAVAAAKAKAGQVAALAVQEAVQMHGGMGMTDEADPGLYMKRQRLLDRLLGDADQQRELAARALGY
ncbi:acyl-CoA dehydrogenase family protein [Brevundimonas sp. 2R-24]|uniref:Acyl-CoA dehydrogenase family protein n=1 Tax=Peiella sedimenti TaxID=3061083 RepID=A0ABT8SQV7_9CAUL|nr:acyl-CoA dehydrogenase family protein [Caulobacteraceae bacterium XZ-24]